MVSLRLSLTVALCLMYVPRTTTAFLRKSTSFKRFGQMPGARENRETLSSRIFFKGEGLQPVTLATRYGSVVLECEVGGTPVPTIHWLKDGVRIIQGSSRDIRDEDVSYEDGKFGWNSMIKMSSTRSRLFLDCLSEHDEAEYTCVAENTLQRASRKTILTVEDPEVFMFPRVPKCTGKRSKKGEPARIYMWTVSRLEYENNLVQLFCRAQGNPKPSITWYKNDIPIQDDEDYKIASNGDLIINDIMWLKNMGPYTCVADNFLGTDTAVTYLYPSPKSDGIGFLL